MWRVAKYGDPYSEFVLFNPSKYTHTVVNAHTVNTHSEQFISSIILGQDI